MSTGSPVERPVLDLEKEAISCGGVVAAVLANIRKMKVGEEMVIKAGEDQVRELREILDLLARHSILRIVSRPTDREYIVVRLK